MNFIDRIAVCSRSFSKNATLREEITQRYSHVTFNEEGHMFTEDSLVNFLRGHNKVITALEKIDEYVLSRLPDLKLISKMGVGLNMIDQTAVQRFGVKLNHTAGVNSRSVAELVLGLMISLLRRVPTANREVLSGKWRQHIGTELTGKTIGLVGFGNIGRDLVLLLQPFRCKILTYDLRDPDEFYDIYRVESVSLNCLLSQADIVSLHVPLCSSSINMLNKERLSLMKDYAILINTARGSLVDEVALKQMLKEKKIAAAGFDVFSVEPPQDVELLALSNFLATPHIGGSTTEAILAMGRAAIAGLE